MRLPQPGGPGRFTPHDDDDDRNRDDDDDDRQQQQREFDPSGPAHAEVAPLQPAREHGVVVVEWGGGLAEGLADRWVDLVLSRSDDADDETRVVVITPHGSRWDDVLAAVALANGASG